MVTFEEAHEAREKHSDYLQQVGAHAIGVDEIIHVDESTVTVSAADQSRRAAFEFCERGDDPLDTAGPYTFPGRSTTSSTPSLEASSRASLSCFCLCVE